MSRSRFPRRRRRRPRRWNALEDDCTTKASKFDDEGARNRRRAQSFPVTG